MALITVYRVESEFGVGPYKGGGEEKLRKKLNKHCASTGRPGPFTDGINIYDFVKFDYFFGFDSPTKLKKWFHGSLTALRESGYVMSVYEVDISDVLFSKSKAQIAFVKKLANPVKSVRIP